MRRIQTALPICMPESCNRLKALVGLWLRTGRLKAWIYAFPKECLRVLTLGPCGSQTNIGVTTEVQLFFATVETILKAPCLRATRLNEQVQSTSVEQLVCTSPATGVSDFDFFQGHLGVNHSLGCVNLTPNCPPMQLDGLARAGTARHNDGSRGTVKNI